MQPENGRGQRFPYLPKHRLADRVGLSGRGHHAEQPLRAHQRRYGQGQRMSRHLIERREAAVVDLLPATGFIQLHRPRIRQSSSK